MKSGIFIRKLAAVALLAGMFASAEAGTLGWVLVKPFKGNVSVTVTSFNAAWQLGWQSAWDQCRSAYPKTRSVELAYWTSGTTTYFYERWNCRDTQ
ncbi:hypothetical protein KIK84_03510 [Curvibacter sp. CHRR-16]|uniref:hypothetical protein n=1 Tax=Curvibacter sp. CHRR-16 TaxID=2835872 RepID=UPI001BDAF3F0|nr:hypothetical protein [Curvibacter sp. CHRR-16]MBT0569379.1 hypothetical protein [Curvibacter sp. CHRR-16]